MPSRVDIHKPAREAGGKFGDGMSDCPRLGKLIGGCRFEPRYDCGAPDLSRFDTLSGGGVPTLIEALKPTTYVHDICVTCGKIVDRPRAIPQ